MAKKHRPGNIVRRLQLSYRDVTGFPMLSGCTATWKRQKGGAWKVVGGFSYTLYFTSVHIIQKFR